VSARVCVCVCVCVSTNPPQANVSDLGGDAIKYALFLSHHRQSAEH